MSHLYDSNGGFANGFMSFLWEAKKAPWRAPARRGNPELSRTAPFGEPLARPHVCWETGEEFPAQHLRGRWDTAEAGGKCHPSTPDPSGVPGVCRAQTHRHVRWGRGSDPESTRLEGWPTSTPKMFRVSRQSTTGKSFAEWWNRSWILPAIVILHEICSGINKNIDRNCLQHVLSPFITVFRNTLMFRDTADVTWHVTHWAATFRNFWDVFLSKAVSRPDSWSTSAFKTEAGRAGLRCEEHRTQNIWSDFSSVFYVLQAIGREMDRSSSTMDELLPSWCYCITMGPSVPILPLIVITCQCPNGLYISGMFMV